MNRLPFIWCLLTAALLVPSAAFAQRELRWDSIDVIAHLDAAGTLHVSETQTIVFTGDWNGGEREFTVHPRQRFSFEGIHRMNGGWQQLAQDDDLDDIDDYAWTDEWTLRWRSRLPSDSPFAGTAIAYQLRYNLSNILLKTSEGYTLDHDFAFRDRAGDIGRFTLRLTLDASWQPLTDVQTVYTAGPLPPAEAFVLTLPLRYSGAGVPTTLDLSRPPEILLGVVILLSVITLGLVWFFIREQSHGRFEPLEAQVDEPWLREHVLKYPAEVVGAIWDDGIGTPEVVALIARMVSEGTLESDIGKGKNGAMTLRLKVPRSKLQGHERTLVERLFFDGRTETSTSAVKAHYQRKGFDPADEIRPELHGAVERVLPGGTPSRKPKWIGRTVFGIGFVLFAVTWFLGLAPGFSPVVLTAAMLVVAGVGLATGGKFRAYLEWSHGAALLCLIPAVTIAVSAAAYLWFYAGTGSIDLHPVVVVAIIVMALGLAHGSINALKTRQGRQALTLRKRLAAGRAFFTSELRKPEPALRDEWYPWLLAFGLGKQMDDWSAQQAGRASTGGRVSSPTTTSTTATTTSSSWSGFAGGRSGGAGGGASWQAAAGSMAAGVSPPSSSGSGGGSSGGGGGSSSGGSSGGGGGGGW